MVRYYRYSPVKVRSEEDDLASEGKIKRRSSQWR